jgi:hypothetical protein
MAADNTSMQKAERDRLFAQLVALGDFRRGSVSENYRKCGKPNCACAQPDHAGHGPRFLWTRSAGRRKTVGRLRSAGELEGAPGGGQARGVHVGHRAGHRGKREDLRGQADGRHGFALRAGGRKKGLLSAPGP